MFESLSVEPEAGRAGDAPALDDLAPRSRRLVRRFIVDATLAGGASAALVAALYADLADDPLALRYIDARFVHGWVPPGWRQVEDQVAEMEEAARQRAIDLAVAWRWAAATADDEEDPLDALARLAGAWAARKAPRSIFDDPEDLDDHDLVGEADFVSAFPPDRPLRLHDLHPDAQERLRLFAVEERLERGLPPVELMELYRHFETVGDARARQYLDRIYVEREPPDDWRALQRQADEALALAELRGRDAGRLFAELRRQYVGLDALSLLRLLSERLQQLR